jgi:hypothetical protein
LRPRPCIHHGGQIGIIPTGGVDHLRLVRDGYDAFFVGFRLPFC